MITIKHRKPAECFLTIEHKSMLKAALINIFRIPVDHVKMSPIVSNPHRIIIRLCSSFSSVMRFRVFEHCFGFLASNFTILVTFIVLSVILMSRDR